MSKKRNQNFNGCKNLKQHNSTHEIRGRYYNSVAWHSKFILSIKLTVIPLGVLALIIQY